jgi:hypothetical protein
MARVLSQGNLIDLLEFWQIHFQKFECVKQNPQNRFEIAEISKNKQRSNVLSRKRITDRRRQKCGVSKLQIRKCVERRKMSAGLHNVSKRSKIG